MDNNITDTHSKGTDNLFDFFHIVGENNMWPPIMLFIYIMVTVLGLIGNIFVMYLTVKKQKLGISVSDVYILNRSLADILFLCVVPFGIVSFNKHGFFFGHVMCIFMSAMMQAGTVVSVAFLVLFAEDCYLVHCCKSHEHRTRVQKIGSCMVWLVAVLFAPLFGFLTEYRTTSNCNSCLPIPLYAGDSSIWGVVVIFTVVFPIFSLWVYILLTSPRKSQNNTDVEHLVVSTEEGTSTSPFRSLMVALSRTITICQCPYWLYRIVTTVMPTFILLTHFYFIVLGLFGLSFVLNPMLYVWYRT